MPMIFIIALFIFFLDQSTKLFITKNLCLHQSLPVIKNIFYITLVYNKGAAFGILKGHVYLFIFTSVLAVSLIVSDLIKHNKHKIFSIYNLSLALILGGAAGNFVDRVFLGHVIDFLDFRIWQGFNWPVFNIADSAITVGAVLLGWSIINSRAE